MTQANMLAPGLVGVMPGTPQAAWRGSADRGMDALGWTAGRVSRRVIDVIEASPTRATNLLHALLVQANLELDR
jgi:hypothetical protein